MATSQPTPEGTGGNILGAAFMQYAQGTGSKNNVPASQVNNPSAQYEYGQLGRTGKDTDGDGFREVDCSVLVLNGLRNAGYNVPGVVPNSESINFTTSTLFHTPTLGKGVLTDAAKQNFDKIEQADLKPGDIVLFAPNKAGNAQHIGIYYGRDAAGKVMFYGSQSSTGPSVATVSETGNQNYWGGDGTVLFTALRPKPELYVPEMDLTGGAGTGLSSNKVIAAVNLLKNSNVEGYRTNIYSNNTSGSGDGVPTVGNGLALVVKGSNGWVVRPENEIRDLLRDAGLSESKYNDLPFDKLKDSASLLNQGRLAEARAIFGTGESGGFSVTPAEADKLTGSFVIRNVIPPMVKALGDAESFALLEPGEFAAFTSKQYQNPAWLESTTGRNTIDAWWGDDTNAVRAALGTGPRGNAEASAYAGNISTINEYLSAKNTDESGNGPTATLVAHWDDRTAYDIMTGLPIGGANKIRVEDKPEATATSATLSPTPVANSASASAQSHTPAASSAAHITTVAGATGDPLTFKLANGKQIKAGDNINSSDGRLVSFDSAKDTLIVDVKIGENLYERRIYSGAGQVSTQSWEYAENQIDGDTGQFAQYFDGDVYQIRDDTYVFVARRGLVHQATGGLAATIAEINQFIQTEPKPSTKSPNNDDDTDDGGGEGDSPVDNLDTSFKVADLTTPSLASHFSGGATGTYGAGQIGGFDVLPFNDKSSFLVNADGDIAGEIHLLGNGYVQIKDLAGNAAYVSEKDGGVLSPSQYDKAQDAAHASTVGSALGLMQNIIGLQNWEHMSDLQRVAAITSIYNVVDKLSGGELPSELGGAAAVLGLLNALDKGDIGGIAISGIAVADFFGKGMASEAIGTALGIEAIHVIPGLSLVLALDSGNPVSVLAAAASFIPGYGQALSIAISLFGSALGGAPPDIPMREGIAHAEWDAAGNTQVITDQNIEGGGATASGWMNSLVNGLQTQLAQTHDAAGNSYGLVPNLLPAIGFQYDPDGFNLANGAKGFMVLRWTDESGNLQTRYYDGAGSRGDGTGETLAGDFMAHTQGAIAPSWQVATTLAHFQQGQGIHLPTAETGLPQAVGDGVHQNLQALTLALPVEPVLVDSLVDVDGDGYLEQTQWLANNQSVLAIDANGNNHIDAGEMLSLNGAGLSSLGWLDANNDHLIDARDPAFAALRLWIDVNSDGNSSGETSTLTQAGITAIDFGSSPPGIIYADGSRKTLTVQTLAADILGTRYQNTEGGILQLDEQRNADGTLTAPMALLHAVNTRLFDGQAAHINGGIAAATTPGTSTSSVDAGDTRLSSTSARTIASQSMQTSTTVNAGDARLQSAPNNGAAGQTQTQITATTAVQIRSNAIAFVPAAGTSAAQEQRQATEAMIRSTASTLFDTAGALPLAAMAVGVAAMQWPTVASAASNSNVESSDASTNTHTRAQTNAQTWPADQARNDSQLVLAALATSVTTDLTGDTWIADQSRNDSYQTIPLTTAATPAETPQPWMGAQVRTDSAFVMAPEATGATLVTPDSIQDSGIPDPSAQSGQATTFTTAAGVVLDYPRVQGERLNGVEDTTLRFAETLLLANDSTSNASAFPNQPGLRITSVFAPVHGSVALQTGADGSTHVVFAPEANYHGAASFSYTVTDQYGLSGNATTVLRIAAVNDAPVAAGETASGDEDHTLRFTAGSLLANDSDVDTAVDGDVLRITRVGMAQHGQVFLAPDGTVSFMPDSNYNGPARFSYWVSDRDPVQIAAGVGYETAASVSLTVLPVNDLPVVTGEILTHDEDVILNINPALLLANDTDVDVASNGQVLSISAVSNARHGTIALLPDGTLQFTPERDYFGAAGFSYTVNDGAGGLVTGQVVVNLAPINDAPALVGETITINEDEIQTISAASLLANDSDVDNLHTALRIVSVGNATHGNVALNPDGSIRFAPDTDYFGPALFTYTVSDGSGGFSVGTAILDIAPVNDAPRLTGESLTLDEDTQAHFSIASLLINDTDVDNAHSDLTITAAVMDADSAANGTVSIVAGQIVFTPTLNFNGRASFSYTASDGVGGESSTSVNLTFNPINDAPVANSELVFGKRDVSYTLSQAALLANDTDAETPNNLHINSISNVLHGTAVLQVNGSVRFTPDAGYTGRGSFDYVVMDPEGATSTATAQIDFSRINTSPIATNDSFTGFEDVALSITAAQLLVNDSDADNVPADLRVTAVEGATNGTVSLQPDGSVRFLANANFYGTASFNYQVSDGDGGQTWAMAQLSVQSVNDAPVIEDVWWGRPIYGSYQQIAGYDESGQPVYSSVQVSSESQARSLYYSGQLSGSSGSFYQNGQLRPAGFTYGDASAGYDESGYSLGFVDSPYRQNGGIVAYDPDGDSSQLSFSISGNPQHGHAWANMYTSASAPGSLDHTEAAPYWVGEAGAWQYYSQRGDGYTGMDYFSVRATDSGGAFIDQAIGVTHLGSSAGGGGGGKKPVTLDLNGNGLHYIGIDDSKAYFDINNDGWREHLAWLAPDDGLLVRDIGGDGRIDRYDEISFTGYLPGAQTDLEGLTAFDSNHDGLLSRLDTRWKEFAVWQDRNGNGVSEAGEVRTPDDTGIAEIGLISDQQTRTVNGVTEYGQARFVWTDAQGGHTGAVGDVSLPFDVTERLPALESFTVAPTETLLAPPQSPTSTPMHMALLMTQMINAMTAAPDATPLTFVPLGNDVELQHAQVQAQDQWEQAAGTNPLQAAAS